MLDSMRQKLQKRPRGVRGLQIFCIIFLLGNLLFFSTGIFMPKHYKDVEIAPIGTELELGEYTLTITSWDWAEKDRAFEIIFEVKDLSLNREPGYTFRFRCGDSHYRYKIYRDLGDLLVVRVSGVSSRFAQVAMTVKAGSASRSIYMDDRTMAHVERTASTPGRVRLPVTVWPYSNWSSRRRRRTQTSAWPMKSWRPCKPPRPIRRPSSRRR